MSTVLALVATATLCTAQQFSRYFDQPLLEWRALAVNSSSPSVIRTTYDWTAEFTGGNRSNALTFNSSQSVNTEATWSTATGSLLSTVLCPERHAELRYSVEYLPKSADPGGVGFAHKVVFASDDEYQDWPEGIGFLFGSGTASRLNALNDYHMPVAYVYKHTSRNTCNQLNANNCTEFVNAAMPPTAVGKFTILMAVQINTVSKRMRPTKFIVQYENATTSAPLRLFDIPEANLSKTPDAPAARWLLTPTSAPSSLQPPRIYFMNRYAKMIVRDLVLDVSESCGTGFVPTTSTASSAVPTTATAVSTESAADTQTLPPVTVTTIPSPQTLANDSVSTSGTASSNNDTEALPTVLPPQQEDGESSTVYIFAGVVVAIVLLGTCVALYFCRHRVIRSKMFQFCYSRMHCRTCVCCCCTALIDREISSTGSDEPMLIQRMDVARAEFLPPLPPKQGTVRRNTSRSEYDAVALPPPLRSGTEDTGYGSLPGPHYVPGKGMVLETPDNDDGDGYAAVRPAPAPGAARRYDSVPSRPQAAAASPEQPRNIYDRLVAIGGSLRHKPSRPAPAPVASKPAPVYDQVMPIQPDFEGIDLGDASTESGSADQHRQSPNYEAAAAVFHH